MNSNQAKPYSEIQPTEDDSTYFESTRKPTQVLYEPAQPEAKIDPDQARFPYCIVWTPLPLISWFLPFIGHTGIAMSNGVIHDFAGPYTITIDDLAFGETHKYVPLQVSNAVKYDQSVAKADQVYEGMNHNIFCNNCHSHVARALNKYQYNGKSDHTMVDVWWLTVSQSRYVSWGHVIKAYIGFMIIMMLIMFVKIL